MAAQRSLSFADMMSLANSIHQSWHNLQGLNGVFTPGHIEDLTNKDIAMQLPSLQSFCDLVKK